MMLALSVIVKLPAGGIVALCENVELVHLELVGLLKERCVMMCPPSFVIVGKRGKDDPLSNKHQQNVIFENQAI